MSSSIDPLPRTSPECAGISSSAVLAFIDALEANTGGPHSFMLLRHGHVAAEGWWAPYAPQIPHALFSLSKSFASTAVGFAVSEGLLTVDDPVISFFPDRLPDEVPENLQAMRVRHLLSMATGHDQDATGAATAAPEGDWVKAFLALPVEHAPGSKFVYNSAATYMCSAIVQGLTGKTLLDYLTPRLFEPLGIEGAKWDSCPRGVSVGGWGLSLKTEDIARFGQCYLQKGAWNGRQLVPAAWVSEATAKQVSNGDEGDASDWTQGYGYQFWRCRHNGYRGDGAFGQFCVVLPEQDAVLAITGGHGKLQEVLDAAWDHLLPGMDPGTQAAPDIAGSADLARRIAHLAVPAPVGGVTSVTAGQVSGRTYRLEPNDQGFHSAAFAFSEDGGTMTLRGEEFEQSIASGAAGWTEGTLPGPKCLPRSGAPPVGKIAARGAWTDEDTYMMKVCYLETPFVDTVTCRFSDVDVALSREMNAGFGGTEPRHLAGRAM